MPAQSLGPLVVMLPIYALGRQAEFESMLQAALEAGGGEAAAANPAFVALAYAYTGEVDTAFEWLDRATREQVGGPTITFNPLFANLHDDPRWPAFQERMGQSPAQLAAVSFEVRVPR